MATTYIVEGHLGGIYLSQADIDVITKRCPQCGDCDWPIADFDPNDEESVLRALHDAYLGLSYLPTKEYVEGYPHTADELKDVREEVQDAFYEKNMRSFCDTLNEHPWPKEAGIPASTVDKFVSLGSQYLSEFDFLDKALEGVD